MMVTINGYFCKFQSEKKISWFTDGFNLEKYARQWGSSSHLLDGT
jgi:hypothetical protein